MPGPAATQIPSGRRSLSILRQPKVIQVDHDPNRFPDAFEDAVPDVPEIDTRFLRPQTSYRRRFYSHGQNEAEARQPLRRTSMVGLSSGATNASPTDTSQDGHKRAGSLRVWGFRNHRSRESLATSSSSRPGPTKGTSSSNWLQRAANATFRSRRRSNLVDTRATSAHNLLGVPERQPSYSQVALVPQLLRGGDAARAAAAAIASTDKLDTFALPSPKDLVRLRDGKLSDDNESGIGIDVPEHTTTPDPADSMSRLDPASLPEEIFHHILTYLDATSLMRAELVSRRWNMTAGSRTIWRDIFTAEFHRESSVQSPIQMGGLGLGGTRPDQDWKQMWKVRQALDARWNAGRAAAIYLEGHSDSVYCVQFDEEKIITGSRDRTIRVWDLRTFACIRVLGVPKDTSAVSPMTPIGSRMARHKPIATLTPPPARCVSPAAQRGPLHHHGSILCLKFDATTMVTGSSDTSLIVWDLTAADYTPVQRLARHRAGVLDVCFDARHIVSCSKDTTICVWDRPTRALVARLTGHLGPVNAVQLRGAHVVSASGDGVAKLWHLPSHLCVKEFPSRDRGLACVEFSPDGRTILAGGNDQVIYQFDANTGELVRELAGHANLVRSVHLDARAGRVISGSYDYSVKAFALDSGRCLADFVGWTTSWMLSAVADYRRIVATSQDGRVVVMDFGWGVPGIGLLDGQAASHHQEEPRLVPLKV